MNDFQKKIRALMRGGHTLGASDSQHRTNIQRIKSAGESLTESLDFHLVKNLCDGHGKVTKKNRENLNFL